MSRCLLIDNDAFLLLAGASLLEEAVTEAGFTLVESRRLRTLEFMLRRPARALQKYPAEVISRALEACARVSHLEQEPSLETLAAFEQVSGVDDGEAVLYGIVAENEFHFLASNDKTAMRAIACTPELAATRGRAAGRVICLEWLVKRLIGTHGAELISERFMRNVNLDKRLDAILSPATAGRPQDCALAAESFLDALRRELGEDFLHP